MFLLHSSSFHCATCQWTGLRVLQSHGLSFSCIPQRRAVSFCRLHLQSTFRWDPVNLVRKSEPVRSSGGPSLPLLHSPNWEAEAMHVSVSLEWDSGSKLSCLNLKSQKWRIFLKIGFSLCKQQRCCYKIINTSPYIPNANSHHSLT